MILVGFAFLNLFLKNYSYSSIGFTYFVIVISIQMYLLWGGLWDAVSQLDFSKIKIRYEKIADGLFCATAVLISFGAMLGKATKFQIIINCIIEVAFYAVNKFINI